MEILTPLLALILGITTSASFHAIHLLLPVAVYSLNAQTDNKELSILKKDKYNKFRPLFIAFGHFLSIILIGFIALSAGFLIKDFLIYFQIPAIIFIFLVGLYFLFIQKTNICGDKCGCKTNSPINKLKTNGLLNAFFFGFSIGLLCIACIFPIFGTIIAMTTIINYNALFLLFSYTIGHTLPIFFIAYLAYIPFFSKKFTKNKIEKNIILIRKISGIILILISIYLFWNFFTYNHKHDDHHYYYNNSDDGYYHY